jgi:hypothetical protein
LKKSRGKYTRGFVTDACIEQAKKTPNLMGERDSELKSGLLGVIRISANIKHIKECQQQHP